MVNIKDKRWLIFMANKVYICGINTSALPTLSTKESQELMAMIKQGDESAREKFIYSNMKLVLSICQYFIDRKENLDDIFQIGCVGLIKAIDNFNIKLNVKFSTYAVPMIRGEIKRYLRDNSLVRVSRSLRDIAYQALKSRDKLTKENQEEPSVEQIAKDTGIDIKEIVCALDAISDIVSLDEPIYNDGEDAIVISDQLKDESLTSDYDKLDIKQALDMLNKREREILLLRYYEGKTQIEISEEIGISQAQVSRLEKNAIKNMKKLLL